MQAYRFRAPVRVLALLGAGMLAATGTYELGADDAMAGQINSGGAEGLSPPPRLEAAARELVLTAEDTHTIAERLRGEGIKPGTSGATAGSGQASANFSVGTVLPVSVTMRDFPLGLTAQMPALNGLKYVRLLDRILIVSPAERVVLAEVMA
ncbi:MAG: hypothetical protein ACLPKB_27865 [Xanthobacteraceae bacterium]